MGLPQEGRQRSETVARRIDVGGPPATTGDDGDMSSDLERFRRVGDQAFVGPSDVHPDLTWRIATGNPDRDHGRKAEHGLIDDGRLGGREPIGIRGVEVLVAPGSVAVAHQVPDSVVLTR